MNDSHLYDNMKFKPKYLISNISKTHTNPLITHNSIQNAFTIPKRYNMNAKNFIHVELTSTIQFNIQILFLKGLPCICQRVSISSTDHTNERLG